MWIKTMGLSACGLEIFILCLGGLIGAHHRVCVRVLAMVRRVNLSCDSHEIHEPKETESPGFTILTLWSGWCLNQSVFI